MRVLLDTNVLIDLIACREQFLRETHLLKAVAVCGDVEVWVSAKSFTDVFYVCHKGGHFSSEELQNAFLQNLTVLKTCSVTGEDIALAASRKWPDFEDCLVALCAEKVGADFLLTRDAQGFSRSAVRTCTPKEFFALLQTEQGVVYEEIDWGEGE